VEIVAILVLIVVALSGAAYAYYWYSPAPLAPHLSTAVQRSTMRLGERERTYLAYVPANLPPKSALVIVLHGSGMDGKRMRECTGYEFDRLADQRGFAVLYPDGYRHNWNDCRMNATFPAKRENIDDMSFIRALIERCKAEQAIDDKRVYVFGYSNGGRMAFRLAMEAPEAIAAVTAVAASLPTPDASSCPQHGPTSRVMLVNGTDDPVSPYQGGVVRLFGLASSRGTVLSAKASARTLAERNGITAAPVAARLPTDRPNDPTSVETLIWSAAGKPICCLYSVHGGGHVIPQQAFRFPRLLGRTTSALNAPIVAISFFEGNAALDIARRISLN
jgi:polyhydroxybutyrate depolymerase